MECQTKDSQKLFKVFDATKRKRTRKKQALEDTNSIASDDSNGGCEINGRRVSSAKASFQDLSRNPIRNMDQDIPGKINRERESSQSIPRSPDTLRPSRSRRHRRIPRDGVSLALKAGLVSTPRSLSPHQDCDGGIDSVPRDQDSFIYAFLEDAIKRDKKKHRRSRKREERRSRDREESSPREHHHHRKHRDEPITKDKKSRKDEKPSIDQAVLLETFAKLYAQIRPTPERVPRSQSNKSLQCEVVSRRGSNLVRHHQGSMPPSRNVSKHNISPSRIRSHGDCRNKEQIRDISNAIEFKNRVGYNDPYENSCLKYVSRQNVTPNAIDDERFQEHPLKVNPTRCHIDRHYRNPPTDINYREYHERREGRPYDEDKMFEQKASRSFEVNRDRYEDGERCRRTARSDGMKERSYGREYRDKRYEERDKRYEEMLCRDNFEPKDFRHRDYANMQNKSHHMRRNSDFERASVISRDDFRDRDKYSERERDSGLSVADEEASIISGKSNYLRAVKQEISEQREAMDKMMKLWKELMRAFKGVPSQSQGPTKSVTETTANVRESGAAQLRLWRECMHRYETVARDVGDTDARLMEEINKQRSEMGEMATMWQECLQRYRDMSKDFNSLKQQLVTSESPTRMAAAPPLVCTDGEGLPPAPYRLPSNYPQHITGVGGPYVPGGQLRAHLSAPTAPPAPPPWWWAERCPSPRRRSSPDSRASRERHHRHKDRERDDSRHKEKSKPCGAKSEHRRKKR